MGGGLPSTAGNGGRPGMWGPFSRISPHGFDQFWPHFRWHTRAGIRPEKGASAILVPPARRRFCVGAKGRGAPTGALCLGYCTDGLPTGRGAWPDGGPTKKRGGAGCPVTPSLGREAVSVSFFCPACAAGFAFSFCRAPAGPVHHRVGEKFRMQKVGGFMWAVGCPHAGKPCK